MAAVFGIFFEWTPLSEILLDLTTPPAGEDYTMSKRQRKHTEQAFRRDFHDKEGNPITVTFKRPVAVLRRLLVEEQQAQWDEIKLVHQLSKWI